MPTDIAEKCNDFLNRIAEIRKNQAADRKIAEEALARVKKNDLAIESVMTEARAFLFQALNSPVEYERAV